MWATAAAAGPRPKWGRGVLGRGERETAQERKLFLLFFSFCKTEILNHFVNQFPNYFQTIFQNKFDSILRDYFGVGLLSYFFENITYFLKTTFFFNSNMN